MLPSVYEGNGEAVWSN